MTASRIALGALVVGMSAAGAVACAQFRAGDAATDGGPSDDSGPATDGGSDAGPGDGGADAPPMGDGGTDATSMGDGAADAAPCSGPICPIATGQSAPYDLVVDTGFVYFTDEGASVALDGGAPGTGAVARVATDGGTVQTLVTGLRMPHEIATDTSSVYWLSFDAPQVVNGHASIGQVAKAGGPTTMPASGSDDSALGLALYEGNLVWAEPNLGIIDELLPGQGVIHMSSGAYDVGGVTADTSGVYATVSSLDPNGTPAIISIVAIGGGGLDTRQTTLYSLSTPDRLGAIAVDANEAYYADLTDGTIDYVDKAGGSTMTTVVASDQVNTASLAVDAATGYLYWTTEGTPALSYADGTVMKVPVKGGIPSVVAKQQAHPHGIALDATNVYWTNLGDGTIMATSK